MYIFTVYSIFRLVYILNLPLNVLYSYLLFLLYYYEYYYSHLLLSLIIYILCVLYLPSRLYIYYISCLSYSLYIFSLNYHVFLCIISSMLLYTMVRYSHILLLFLYYYFIILYFVTLNNPLTLDFEASKHTILPHSMHLIAYCKHKFRHNDLVMFPRFAC
jgi:hypothetical protein